MDKNQFYLLAAVCITTHVIRTIYEILKHKKVIRATKLTFVVVFINMFLLWASWIGLCSSDPNSVFLPVVIRYTGIILAIAGFIIFITALLTIKALESYEGDLITHGIYSKIRHPMYLAFILWLIGMPLYAGGFLVYVLAMVFIANVLYWRYLEEQELVKRFPSYREYRKKTVF
jgi:protein-S-isoprenylcysteine O-methyltransferase Ste14